MHSLTHRHIHNIFIYTYIISCFTFSQILLSLKLLVATPPVLSLFSIWFWHVYLLFFVFCFCFCFSDVGWLVCAHHSLLLTLIRLFIAPFLLHFTLDFRSSFTFSKVIFRIQSEINWIYFWPGIGLRNVHFEKFPIRLIAVIILFPWHFHRLIP